jgi:hypothetical protein
VREKVHNSKDRKDAACCNNVDLNDIHDDCEKGVTEMRDRKEMEERGRIGAWGGRVLKAGLWLILGLILSPRFWTIDRGDKARPCRSG